MKVSFVVRSMPVVLALCLVGAVASIASAQSDAYVGTWKVNLAKSTYSPGPAPKEATATVEAAAPGVTLLLQGIDGEGKPINPDKNKVAFTMDGKDQPAGMMNPNWDTIASKRNNAHSFTVSYKKAGKVVVTGTNVVSKDGKTMTVTQKGTNAKGETLNNVIVLDKQ